MSADAPVHTGAPPAESARQHIPALDGVRGLAALLVMFFHFGRAEDAGLVSRGIGFFAQFGWGGVDLFFVLSGFLIGGILLDARDRPKFLRTFYKRRALRIFPLYFLFLAAFIFVILPLLPGAASDLPSRQKWLWFYLGNIDIARNGWYTGSGGHANGLWSLAIEEQFYLVAPFAVLLLPKRGVAWLAAAGVVGSLAARVVLAHAGYPARVGYAFTFSRVDGLSAGVLLALAARSGNVLDRVAAVARWAAPLAATFVLVYALVVGQFAEEYWPTLEIALPVMTLAFAALLVLAVSNNGSPALRRILEGRALRFFGLYSYSLYIWHPLVGSLLRMVGISQRSLADALGSSTVAALVTMPIKMAAATLVAVASYRVIERPFLRLKNARPRLAPAVVDASGPAFDA